MRRRYRAAKRALLMLVDCACICVYYSMFMYEHGSVHLSRQRRSYRRSQDEGNNIQSRADYTIRFTWHWVWACYEPGEISALHYTHHCHSPRASSNSSSANLLSSPPRRRPSLASRPIPRTPHAISEYIPVALHALMRPSLER